MDLLRALWLFARCGVATFMRRWRNGPARPSWTWRQETAIEANRRLGRALVTLPVASARRRVDALSTMARADPSIACESVADGGPRGLWFAPTEISPRATLLYFHGGGYVLGSLRSHRELITRLTKSCRTRTLAIEYRRAPEHPFPAAVEDCAAAYRWLLDSGTPAADIVLAGDSAGGGLAVAVMVWAREEGLPLPAGAVLLSPWVDLASSCASTTSNAPFDWGDREYLQHWARQYLDGAPPTDALASPVHADLTGLPPLLVHVGEAELLADEVRFFASRAQNCAVSVDLHVYADMVHGFHAMASLFGAGEDAIAEVGAWTARLTRRKTSSRRLTPPRERPLTA